MKNLISTFFLLLMFGFSATGQEVMQHEGSMSLGKQPGYYVEIDGADDKMVEKVFKEMMKDYGKVKRNKKAGEWYSQDVKVPMIAGSDVIDLYLKIDERASQTTAYLWATKAGTVVDENELPSEAQGMQDFLSEFYLAVKRKALGENLKEQEKLLSKLEKGQEKLEKKNEGYHKDIEKAKEKIRQAEENIEQNLKDQDDQQVQIANQKKEVEKVIEKINNLGKG